MTAALILTQAFALIEAPAEAVERAMRALEKQAGPRAGWRGGRGSEPSEVQHNEADADPAPLDGFDFVRGRGAQ